MAILAQQFRAIPGDKGLHVADLAFNMIVIMVETALLIWLVRGSRQRATPQPR